ncbi:M1 family aminopeptidase [Ferruginibacter sp. HRS2-29]|uniref:M1 family aminopeptidase n=1 Tax=Ferruginibacter sp. HRS2-29 TaxID=2487334 RepID=UPI0020CC98BA|nr:M1 family aminopeptidase [Ferruginibacter sp. HRS2-29]MCP9751825.1 T9SS C-terminal target domain-containing protein [Ferruginibacter sp. HRS2-29]
MKAVLFILLNVLFIQVGFAQTEETIHECSRKGIFHQGSSSNSTTADFLQYSTMDKYDVKYLKLDLSAEPGSRYISGSALTVAKVLQPLDSFVTELRSNMIVDSVFINGIKLPFTRGQDHIFIPIAPALAAGTMVQAKIFYNGTASSAGVYAGTVASNGLSYTATLSESYQAREWFPAKQLLYDKIDSADIWITTTGLNNRVGSNGTLKTVVALSGNRQQFQWKTNYGMSYYMPSFSIGNYMEYKNYAKPAAMAPDSILVQHYIVDNPTYFNSVKTNLDKTPAFIEKYSELYGLYPFKNEKYGHAHASIGGGMEHQTMSTMNSFGSTLIAHELAHQWFGDHVTCATWNDIWLNEGFATYSEYLAIETLPALFTTTTAAAYMQSMHTNVLSSATGSVYVPQASIFDENRIFSSRLSYNKGAAIIHTLRFEMQNDALFFQTLKNYQDTYKYNVATATDFKNIAEATSGKNLTDFFNQWYYGEGYPTFNITFLKEGTGTIALIVNQTVSAPSITPFFKGLYEFTITSAAGDTTVKVNLTANNQTFRFNYNKTPTGIIVDPNNWVLNTTGSIINAGTVLPVKLVKFEGEVDKNCNALLKWSAANEINVAGYTLEYSIDNSVFKTAAIVPAKNNLSADYNSNYSLPSATTYYFRLKTMDKNGDFSYSNILKLQGYCQPAFSVKAGPIPSSGPLNLSVTIATQGRSTIWITNALGEKVHSETRLLNAGENKFSLPVFQKFAAGTYFLNVQDERGKTMTVKLIKNK